MPEIDEPVHVVEYQTSWPAEFAAEHARIVGALSLRPGALQHIGSTAVPGLPAKPIIDLMLGVDQLPPVEKLVGGIVDLGYEALGEAGVPERWYFRRRVPTCHNLHVVRIGGAHWANNLALRDYLRAHASARKRYAQAKLAALASGSATLLSYSAAKSDVIADLLGEAHIPKCG